MAGTQKVLNKLQRSLEAGSYYDAQQAFKSVYYRYRAQKKLIDSYKLCEEGAKLQLQKGQLNCGVELALLLLEAYTTDKVTSSRENMERVFLILDAFPRPETGSPEAETAVDSCTRVVQAAIKWAKRFSTGGDHIRKLHDKLAIYVWECFTWQGFGTAAVHYARGTDATSFAAALAQCVMQGNPEEEDLFVARAALQLLAAGRQQELPVRVEDAQELLQALAKRSLPLVEVLESEYASSLSTDRLLVALVSQIKQVYFKVQQSGAGGMQGLLSGMMQMLGEG
eukprot:jgi/Astpho2/9823/fgenesh1_pg.00149_%23_71_t